MILIVIFAILIIVSIILIASLFQDEDKENGSSLFFALIVLMIFSVVFGIELGLRDTKTYKKPLKPTKVRVECVNGKCDTTYIYEFKN